jgi:hypothetical protein
MSSDPALVRRRTSQTVEQRRLRFARRQKRIARGLVNKALETGALVRHPCCERCASNFKLEAHHEDYTKPLEVTWLCVKCHNARHDEMTAQGINPDVPGLWPEEKGTP